MDRILITGCAGFIGFHLSKFLLNKKCEIVGIDNLNTYYDKNLKLDRLKILLDHNFKFYKIDITNRNKLKIIFEKFKPNYVINLAAYAGVRFSLKKPKKYIESNIIGFFHILEMCSKYKVKHLIYASSSSVYGLNQNTPYYENTDTSNPISIYGASKKTNEVLANSYAYIHNLPITGLRFFTVYGPWGRPDMAYYEFTKRILENKKIDVFGFGNLNRDFTYIDDIVFSIFKLLKIIPKNNNSIKPKDILEKIPHQIINVGKGTPVNLLDFIEIIENNLKINAKKNFVKHQIGDVISTEANTNKLESLIKFSPKTDLDKGIKNFIKWYKEYHNIN